MLALVFYAVYSLLLNGVKAKMEVSFFAIPVGFVQGRNQLLQRNIPVAVICILQLRGLPHRRASVLY